MKIRYLLLLAVVIPLIAGPATFEEAVPVENRSTLHSSRSPYSFRQGDTLKYDLGVFTGGLGITGTGSPSADQTIGFSTYFVLSEFGITDPKKVGSILLHFSTLYGTDFRLYVWDDAGGVPNSHATHLYSNMIAPLGTPGTWTAYDLSADNVVLPDTFWVGICYNVLSSPADWYMSYDAALVDIHTYGNLSGGGGDWTPMSTYGYGYAFGVRVVVEDTAGIANDVGTVSYDSPTLVPENTTYDPMATVHNYGGSTETFDVTCEINPGGYTSTKTVTDLAPAANEQVTFDPFQFVSGLYTAKVYTQLSGDANPANDTLLANVEATNWLYYDDGTVSAGWAWYYADNGWGVQFPAAADLWVDSIAAYIYDASWPSPGGTDATFRVYDGASQPTNLRQEWAGTTIVRGAWNIFSCDTTLTYFTAGGNIFFFYIQYLDAFNCPALAIDAAVNAPAGMLWWYNGPSTFGQGNNGGDWLLRVHIYTETGVAEWLDPNVPVTHLRAPTIIGKDGATIEFTLEEATETELVIYDATGRLCKTLVSGLLPAGKHIITPELNLASGIYFINLHTKSGVNIAKKTLLVK